jgi:hypothetical protein
MAGAEAGVEAKAQRCPRESKAPAMGETPHARLRLSPPRPGRTRRGKRRPLDPHPPSWAEWPARRPRPNIAPIAHRAMSVQGPDSTVTALPTGTAGPRHTGRARRDTIRGGTACTTTPPPAAPAGQRGGGTDRQGPGGPSERERACQREGEETRGSTLRTAVQRGTAGRNAEASRAGAKKWELVTAPAAPVGIRNDPRHRRGSEGSACGIRTRDLRLERAVS